MRTWILLPLTLAACSPAAPDASPETNAAVDPGNAPSPLATVAPGSTPSVAASTPTPLPTPSAQPSAAPTQGNVLEDGPEQSVDAAAQLVRRYYRLIASGDYAAAWRLWDGNGRASGMSAAAFADSFARYARYDAAVGTPGRVDAGAGQRYVEVPVSLTGTLKSGEPFAMRGTVVLHRAGPIDGATPEQRRWHISDTTIRPAPTETPTPDPAPSVARYRCADGSLMLVRFDPTGSSADVELGGELLGKLDGQRTAATLRYERGETLLRGDGEDATLVRPTAKELACKVQR